MRCVISTRFSIKLILLKVALSCSHRRIVQYKTAYYSFYLPVRENPSFMHSWLTLPRLIFIFMVRSFYHELCFFREVWCEVGNRWCLKGCNTFLLINRLCLIVLLVLMDLFMLEFSKYAGVSFFDRYLWPGCLCIADDWWRSW